ncbi:MAG: methyltransferase domain-containing protein [Candidatus Eisenbacteria bacterium]|nr:methyltransferase domain-containing protein [Candidatus Eisenbacteria bacterium]
MQNDVAHRDEAPLFIEEILGSLEAGKVVLDAGCGAGSFQHSKFPKLLVVSIDIKRPNASGSDTTVLKPLPPNFVVGDIERLPVRASSVDFVVLNYALEHVSDADAAAAEASRALREGGLLYAAVPNSRSFDDRFYRFAGYFAKYFLLKVHKRLEHQQRFDFVSLNRLFYEKGLRLLSFCECPSGYTWMNDPRVRRFHASFLKTLSLVEKALKIDLFKGSNYLALYQRAGISGIRNVTHVCAYCGMQLLRESDRRPDPRACPYCGRQNAHW